MPDDKTITRASEAYWLGLATGVLSKYGFRAEAEWLCELTQKIWDQWQREDNKEWSSIVDINVNAGR